MFVTSMWSRCGGGLHNGLACFTQEIEDVLLPPPDLTWTVRNRHGNSCFFCSAMQVEAERESQLLTRHSFLKRVQFLVTWFCEQAKSQDLGLPTPKNCLWVSAKLCNVNSLLFSFQDCVDRALCVQWWYSYWIWIQQDNTILWYYLFLKLSIYRSDIIFQRDGSSPHHKIPVR